jgi:hypothetical protein
MLLTLLRSTGSPPSFTSFTLGYIKLSGTWEMAALTYIKETGTWESSKVYIKVSGAWQ